MKVVIFFAESPILVVTILQASEYNSGLPIKPVLSGIFR